MQKLGSSLLALLCLLFVVSPSFAQAKKHKTMYHAQTRLHPTRRAAPITKKVASVKVWGNDKMMVYHYPGNRWYGNTKSGEYMTEDAARKMGARSAKSGK